MLPTLGRRTSVKNAADVELEAAIDLSERLVLLCGVILVFGIAAEFALAAIDAPQKTFLGRWGSAVADLFVLIGVGGEIVFSRSASRCESELRFRSNERLGEMELEAAYAQESAEKARLETEKIRRSVGQRELDKEAFLTELKDQPRAVVEVLFVAGTDAAIVLECEICAMHIWSGLRTAGWECETPQGVYAPREGKHRLVGAAPSVGGMPYGISLVARYADSQDHTGTPFHALKQGLIKGMYPHEIRWFSNEEIPAEKLRIVIAPKV